LHAADGSGVRATEGRRAVWVRGVVVVGNAEDGEDAVEGDQNDGVPDHHVAHGVQHLDPGDVDQKQFGKQVSKFIREFLKFRYTEDLLNFDVHRYLDLHK
jgi:hypothetical protein